MRTREDVLAIWQKIDDDHQRAVGRIAPLESVISLASDRASSLLKDFVDQRIGHLGIRDLLLFIETLSELEPKAVSTLEKDDGNGRPTSPAKKTKSKA
jgi:hypothetical protein